MGRQRVATTSRSCRLWNDSVGRRAVGVSLYAASRGIGLHPALLIESRDPTKAGDQLFLKEACDEGTHLLIVPASAAITADSLRLLGPKTLVNGGGALTIAQPKCIPHLLSDSTSSWLCLAWRLAIERCSPITRQWGWMGLLPTRNSLADETRYTASTILSAKPDLLQHWSQSMQFYQREVKRVHEAMIEASECSGSPCLIPPLSQFEWALSIVIRRAAVVLQPEFTCSVPSLAAELSLDNLKNTIGIIPLVDMAVWAAPEKANAGVDILLQSELPFWYRDTHKDSPFAAHHEANNDTEIFMKDALSKSISKKTYERTNALLNPNKSIVHQSPFFYSLCLRRNINPSCGESIKRDISETVDTECSTAQKLLRFRILD